MVKSKGEYLENELRVGANFLDEIGWHSLACNLRIASDIICNSKDAERCPQIGKTTQGRKGQKLPRINMAFSEENLKHIQIMGRVEGCSATEYVNRLITADRSEKIGTAKAFEALSALVSDKRRK